MILRPVAVFTLAALAASVTVRAAEVAGPSPEQTEFFEKKVRPVFAERCYECHSVGKKRKGGLLLDTRAGWQEGGDTGPVLVPGDPEKSLLIEAIRYRDEDLQMPPKHQLSADEVAVIEEWVRLGAPDPRDAASPKTGVDFDEAKTFWSFRPVSNPAVPAVSNPSWPAGDLDRFLLAALEKKGLTPNPAADKRTLLRRATYDLTGLPPTPEELREFLADSRPDAFAKIVERLLASPAYGEKWGRHWLDLVRYADTSGCNSDFPVPSAHRYRDWVIGAFNRDLPYDEFLREQIAGDLLPAATPEDHFQKVIATGYLAIARRFGSRANEFHLTHEDIIDNLGKVTLGLSLGCARCHDHKFDPVPTADYYALYGIFDSTRFAFPGTEIYPHPKDFTPLVPEPEASDYLTEAREAADLDQRIEDLKNEAKRLARAEKETARNDDDDDAGNLAPDSAATSEEKPKRTSADAKRDLQAAKDRQREITVKLAQVPKAYAVTEGEPHDVAIQRKGDPGAKGEVAPRGFLTVLGGQKLPPEEKGSGRWELAEWIADPANPLTARVMVNRIWEYHFGRGLVKTPNDFGLRGERPTQPELLDWLAQRFIETGWSVKAMHRLMMLSSAYQMSSADRPECSATDVANDLWWRFNRRRLEAEEVRDSVLAVAGTLDREQGAAHPFPSEVEWHYTQHKPFVNDYPTMKRAVYLMQQRIRKQPFLEVFDGADPNATTAVRPVSQTPIQALWMMNSLMANFQAANFAERCLAAFSDEPAQISYATELALGRPAEPEEIQEVQNYLRSVEAALAETAGEGNQRLATAFGSFARVLLSSNEFLFVD